MPKGYWIGHVEIEDMEAYKAYIAANAEAFGAYNARFLVRGGAHKVVEGALKSRHVVIEFASYTDALACYESASYQHAKSLRDPVSSGDLVIIEGYEG